MRALVTLTDGKGIVPGYLRQVPRVVNGENPDISRSADLKTVDAAV